VSHPGNDKTPDRYAQEYLPALTRRWGATLGDALRRYSPVVFPGAPPEALMGFTAIGTQNDDTGDPPVNNSFREIGYFQTEAGPNLGPSPNPDPSAPSNSWGRLANDSRVVALLGHPATMSEYAWRNAIYDQAAVGLYNLLDDAAAVARGIPAAIRPSDPGSLWNVALGFSGFSGGVGGTRTSINRYANSLNVPESVRFAAWVDAVLRDAQAGDLPGGVGSHGNPAYDILRTWQKLAAGKALAQHTGGNTSWFDVGFGVNDAQAQQALTDAAYRRNVSMIPSFAMPSGAAKIVWGLLLAGGVGAAGYFGYDAYKHGRMPAWVYGRRR
jgi:hypothetical protein